MADKIIRWDEFQEYDVAIKNFINTADAKSFKSAKFDDVTRVLSLFKAETTDGVADFTVTIPDTDTSGLLAKLVGATDGHVVVAKTDGTIEDGGVALADLATKDELTQVSDTKVGSLDGLNTTEKGSIVDAINEIKRDLNTLDGEVGDLTALDTTEKGSIVGAINEIEGQVAALQAGTYDDSELRNMIGTLTGLTTTAQDNLVNAINEVDADLTAAKNEAKITIEDGGVDGTSAKVYVIKQNSVEIGKINIPKDMVVQSGQIVTDPAGQTPGKYVELTIANSTGDKIYINVADLVDAYTPEAGATQVQVAISDTNEISATIVAGSVTATELATDSVTTVKIADANVTYAKLATDVTTAFDTAGSATAAETNAKTHADGLNTAMDARVTALESQFTFATSDDINGLFTP